MRPPTNPAQRTRPTTAAEIHLRPCAPPLQRSECPPLSGASGESKSFVEEAWALTRLVATGYYASDEKKGCYAALPPMSSITPDPNRRDYLLPPGCKDLIDVLKQTPKDKPQAATETVPIHPISTEHVFVNGKIPAREVRVCDEAGIVLGIFRLSDALALAESRELDLVLISAKGKPYLCVLIDYGKYRYQQAKKKKRKDAV